MKITKSLADISRHFDNLPMDKLHIGKGQMRTKNTDAGIDDLAASINKVGLPEPIVVIPSETNASEYEIVTGQRRFLAFQHLEKETIPAIRRNIDRRCSCL